MVVSEKQERDNRRYWRNRERNHNRLRLLEEEKIKERLTRKYADSMDAIQKDIDAFYGRFADREGISMREARKRVTKLDIEKYAEKAKRYVKERNFSRRANEEMRLYNVTMRVNRLELLKKNIELELLGLYSEEERNIQAELSKYAREEYERLAGILGSSAFHNEKHIRAIVDSSFRTAHWSENLWQHQNALRAELDKLLNRGIVQGIHPRELARDLRKRFDTSIFNSERLLITEFARVQQDVFIDSMNEAGIEQYEYLAQDSACRICAGLDEKVFYVKDAEAGKNIHPMHPFCRCSTSAYIDREALEREFDDRGLTVPDDDEDITASIPDNLKGKMTDKQYKYYDDLLKGEDASPEAKRLWESYKNDLVLVDAKKRRGAYYKPRKGVYMNLDKDMAGLTSGGKNLQKSGNVFFHEFGHHIDALASRGTGLISDSISANLQLSNGKTLGKTVFDEIEKRISEQAGRLKGDRKKALYKLLEADYKKDPSTMGSLSDLFGGATNNDLRLNMGHKNAYWKADKYWRDLLKSQGKQSSEYRNYRLGSEAFAEMFASDIMDKGEAEQFKKWLPESWDMYRELVKLITKS